MNKTILLGRLTKDVELRYTTGGIAYCSGTIAVDKNLSREKKEQFEKEGKNTADFINFKAWYNIAETLANFTEKGNRVCLNGSLNSYSWIDKENGSNRYGLELTVESVDIIDWKEEKQNKYNNQKVYTRK